ncbi:MAG: hypothetical protein LBG76_08825 [Treponema sp.]|jgi:membrane-bound serine protease (ClpP class)|nr:hypothetical protein [Treponema sp.]
MKLLFPALYTAAVLVFLSGNLAAQEKSPGMNVESVPFSAIGASSIAGESGFGIAYGIIAFLTSAPVQVILILLGLVMIFLEINSPGFGIPGVVAFIAFLAVFGSEALLGQVGSLEPVLFFLGVGLLAVEIFLLPGFGAAGVSGIVLIGLSLIFSMQDFIIPRFDWEWDLLGRNAMVVCIGIIAALIGIAVIALLGPKIRIFDGLTLKTRITGTVNGELPSGETSSGSTQEPNYQTLLGKIGVADTTLRPSGRVEIDGEVYAAEADGLFVDAGRGVRVTRIRGNTVIVRLV